MSLMETIQRALDEKLEDKKKKIEEDVDELDTDINEEDLESNDDDLDDDLDEEKKNKKKKDDEMDDEEDDDDDDDDAKNKKKDKVDVKESLKTIFNKTEVSDDIKDELETLFNAAVSEKVDTEKNRIEEEMDDYSKELIDEMEQNIDKYLEYVAEEWVSENELEVESGIKLEIAENLITGLKDVFTENYVDVPESKVDLIEEAEGSIDQLVEALDQEKEKNMDLQGEIDNIKSTKIVDGLAEEMTATEREKLDTLIDSIDYKDDSDYKEKVGIVIENYFNKTLETDEKEVLDEDKKKDDGMSFYKDFLNKKNK